MRALFHIVDASTWDAASAVGEYCPPTLQTEGFVHCSFAEQVAATLRRHYPGVANLLVVELDPTRLGVPVRVEEATGGGESFPHVYGPIPVHAAVGSRRLDAE